MYKTCGLVGRCPRKARKTCCRQIGRRSSANLQGNTTFTTGGMLVSECIHPALYTCRLSFSARWPARRQGRGRTPARSPCHGHCACGPRLTDSLTPPPAFLSFLLPLGAISRARTHTPRHIGSLARAHGNSLEVTGHSLEDGPLLRPRARSPSPKQPFDCVQGVFSSCVSLPLAIQK
jgi:hypothetical protein